MSESKEPSFGRLVIRKAYSNTKELFKDKVRDTIFAGLLSVLGVVLSWHWYGWPIAIEQTISFAVTSFGPILFVIALVFLWNLWLSPMEIAYQACKANFVPRPTPQEKPINWLPWKRMKVITLVQYSKIFARIDPGNSATNSESRAFYYLLLEAVKSNELKYIKEFTAGMYNNATYQLPIDENSKISRKDAVSWAKSQDIEISHFE